MTNLKFFSAAQNQLSSVIPANIGNLNKLELLDLSRNQFSGTLPLSMGGMSEMVDLELWNNQLTGQIPTELGNLSKMEILRLQDNLLNGSIPPALGSLASLKDMNLGTNQLTGTIPPQLGNLQELVYLYLLENNLDGEIPPELGSDTKLESLWVYNNDLSGTIPKELAQCTQLKNLGVAENNLSGSPPKELGALLNLEVFQANDNDFEGPLPTEYLAWSKLQALYLSNNQFTSVPDFSSNPLTHLTLDGNALTFESIEPYFVNPPADFTYIPQDSTGIKQNFSQRADCPTTFVANVGGTANSYQWYKDGSILSGEVAATLNIGTTAISDAGSYSVSVVNSIVTGLTITTRPFVLDVQPAVNTTLSEDPTNQLCNARKLIASPAGLYSYQWFVDGKKIVGATLNEFNAYYDGGYTVVYQPDPTSCSLTTPLLDIFGLYSDMAPAITSTGSPISKLVTNNAAVSYQWYVDDKVIANAISPDLDIWYNGTYYLQMALSNGCRYKSNEIVVSENNYSSLARRGLEPGDTISLELPYEGITVYPNPTSSVVSIQCTCKISGISFYGNPAMQILKKDFAPEISELQVDVATWNPGIYVISIQTGEKIIWRKLIKY
jgi:Secretion system C-terminal sorting domain/Leucine Rich Repeat